MESVNGPRQPGQPGQPRHRATESETRGPGLRAPFPSGKRVLTVPVDYDTIISMVIPLSGLNGSLYPAMVESAGAEWRASDVFCQFHSVSILSNLVSLTLFAQ
jgi:hypothetical protein